MTNVSEFPNLTAELIRRGYSDSDVAAVLGGNILRVLQAVQDNSAQGVRPVESTMWMNVPGNCRSLE